MSKYLLLGLLIVGIAVGTYAGCGPQAGVAKDKIMDQVNKALGELNVKRKAIEQKQAGLRDKLDILKKNRYTTEARLELLTEKKQKSEAALESIKSKITQLQALVQEVKTSESESIERNGKTYSAADLQAAAEEVASSYKSEQAKLASLVSSFNALDASVNFLKKQEETSSRLMRELEQKISEIDAKKVAVDAVRDNNAIAGDNKSISESLEAMAKEIEDLGVDVEVALRMETDKMTELDSATSKVDEILSEPSDLQSTEDMLNDLLK